MHCAMRCRRNGLFWAQSFGTRISHAGSICGILKVARGLTRKTNMADDFKGWCGNEISKLLGSDVGQEFLE